MFGEIYIGTMNASIGGDGGVKYGWAEMVDCYDGDWDEEVPQVGRESWVDAGECSDKMVFKGSNGAFRVVGTVVAWWLELSFYVLIIE